MTFDNRTMSDVDNYQTARIEAMKRRIKELETENAELQRLLLERWEAITK